MIGKFPNSLKQVDVTLDYKKDDPTDKSISSVSLSTRISSAINFYNVYFHLFFMESFNSRACYEKQIKKAHCRLKENIDKFDHWYCGATAVFVSLFTQV